MDHVDFAQLLGNYGEFIGSIAVLATLIYLALQTRQTSRLTMLTALQANRAERMAWFQSNRDSPFMPKIFAKVEAGEPLDAEETYRLRSHNSALWGSIYSQWLQHELAIAGRFATRDVAMISMAINTPGALEWWELNGSMVYPQEFCAYVDKRTPEVVREMPDSKAY